MVYYPDGKYHALEKPNDTINVEEAFKCLHDFYCGVEKIFERIALLIDFFKAT